MRNIFIKYDPYEMVTEFKVNNIPIMEMEYRDPWLDKVLKADSFIPLQSWIDPVPSENWNGLLTYLEKMGDDKFSFSFCGRKTDFEDLKSSLTSQNRKKGNVFTLQFPEKKQQFIMSDSEMKTAIDEVVKVMSEKRFSDMVSESDNVDLRQKYAAMQENISAINNKEFRVVFTGIYSSGKSTVINALVGKNILPQSEGTCTDKICYIKHLKDVEYAKVVYSMIGGKKQDPVECKNGEEVQELVREASNVKGLEKIEVYVDMSHLFPENLEDQFRLVFVDTPGTGSEEGDDVTHREEDSTHIELTKRILSSDEKEMVVLVSDKKTVSSGISEILDIFENQAGEDHGCYNDRFLFVLNQCDSFKYHVKIKGPNGRYEGLENEVLNLKETVSKMFHGRQKRNIANPRVFPLSAATALAIKIGCNDAKNKPERDTEYRDYYDAYNDFCERLTDHGAEYYINGAIDVTKISENYLLDAKSDLAESIKTELQEKYDHADNINEYLLLHSGILSLEAAIKSYIEKYAFPIKMRKLLRAFKSILEEVNEENTSYLADLEDAKNDIDNTHKKIDSEKESKARDAKRKKDLEYAKKVMERILKSVDAISTDLPEMDDIRSKYLKIMEESNDFFDRRPDGSLVRDITNEKAREIKEKIEVKVKELADEAKDLVEKVKTNRWGIADKYAQEFKGYLDDLQKKGLLKSGAFDIRHTVKYNDIVGDGGFLKYETYARDIDNPDKEHIETDYGILNFFASIGRSIATIFEPSQINRVDAIKYKENLFNLLDGNVNKLINDVQTSYTNDITYMKNQMSEKMSKVLELISDVDIEIDKRNKKIKTDLETEESYIEKKKALEKDCEFLRKLIYKLNVIKQGG